MWKNDLRMLNVERPRRPVASQQTYTLHYRPLNRSSRRLRLLVMNVDDLVARIAHSKVLHHVQQARAGAQCNSKAEKTTSSAANKCPFCKARSLLRS